MGKHKILIVEDNEDFLRPLKIRLENKDFEVIAADDGYSGYEIAKQERPDLIIMDVVLPNVDGFQACRLLKSDTYLKDTPIIMISGLKKDEADREKGLTACGADEYLLKPLDHVELINTINKLIPQK
ncbi:MAG: response regulator [Candidatus Omnitrophota bacterium]